MYCSDWSMCACIMFDIIVLYCICVVLRFIVVCICDTGYVMGGKTFFREILTIKVKLI